MCTLINERLFRIESIGQTEMLIRAGLHKGEYSIPLSELEQADQDLKKNKEIGEKAETIVLNYEKQKLIRLGLEEKVKSIRQVSKNNCAAGYDIFSFNEQGKPIYLEVKGSLGESPHCFLTANEIEKGKNLGKDYLVYHVKMYSLKIVISR